MKRKFIFILICIIYSVLAFGKNENKEYEVEDTVGIKAIVVKPIKLNLELVDFGSVVKGQTKEQPDVQGKIIITGDKKSSVKIKIRCQEQELDITREDQVIHLKNIDNKFKNMNLVYYPKFVLGNNQEEIINDNFSLDKGSLNIYSRGKVFAPKSSEKGSYLGEMEIQVYYEK